MAMFNSYVANYWMDKWHSRTEEIVGIETFLENFVSCLSLVNEKFEVKFAA